MLRSPRLFYIALLTLAALSCAENEGPPPKATRIVSGRVVADHNQEPISGARVSFGKVVATTDPSGSFSLRIPRSDNPAHLDVVRASAAGFGRSGPRVARDEPMEIRLQKAFSVSAMVVDQAGVPLPGVRARVRARRVSQSPALDAWFEREALSGPDGRVRVEGISRVITSQTLTLEADGYGTTDVPVRILEDVRRAGVDVGTIAIGPAHTVRLTVLGPDGVVMPETRITLRGTFEREGVADADGVAVFDGLSTGRHHFIVFPRGMRRLAALVEVAGDEALVEATVGPPSGESLTVLVRDAAGGPVAGASVSPVGIGGIPATGADGKTTIFGLPDHPVRASVRPPRGVDLFGGRLGPVVPTGQEVVVTLRDRATLSGRVLRVDGSAVDGARVRLADADGETVAGGRTTSGGQFSIDGPAGVPLRLTAFTRGPVVGSGKVTRAAPNALGAIPEVTAPAKGLQVTLRPLSDDRTLAVRVLGPDGGPVAGAEVVANGSISRPLTDGDGRKVFSGLSEWPLTLSARCGRIHAVTVPPVPLTVVPANQEVELRFRAAMPIRGRVTLPDGTPVRGAEIELTTEDGTVSHARSEPDGGFIVAALPGRPHSLAVRYETAERYIYRAWRSGLVPGEEELEVTLELSGE